jgi:hypothetical protein
MALGFQARLPRLDRVKRSATDAGVKRRPPLPVEARTVADRLNLLLYCFADVFMQTEGGPLAIDYRRFHNAEPIQSNPSKSGERCRP